MSISNGFNSVDNKYEKDFEDGIAFAENAGELAEQYEKDLLDGKTIWSDGVEWSASEMVGEAGLCYEMMFKAIMTGDHELIANLREEIRAFILPLAQEEIANLEPDYD